MPLARILQFLFLGEVWPRRSFALARVAVVVKEGMVADFTVAEEMVMAMAGRVAGDVGVRSDPDLVQSIAAFPMNRWKVATASHARLAKCPRASRLVSSRPRKSN